MMVSHTFRIRTAAPTSYTNSAKLFFLHEHGMEYEMYIVTQHASTNVSTSPSDVTHNFLQIHITRPFSIWINKNAILPNVRQQRYLSFRPLPYNHIECILTLSRCVAEKLSTTLPRDGAG